MATEAPLIHDGSNCVAGVDYSASGSQTANGYQSSGQYLAVAITGPRTVGVPAAGAAISGILQNKPTIGMVADIGILGVTKAVAGAAITAGWQLMTNANGQLIHQTSTNAIVAVALESVTAAGQLVTVRLVPTAG